MPTLEIDGIGKVQVGDEFTSMSPADQQAFVGYIADQAGKGVKSSLGGAAPQDTPPSSLTSDVAKSAGAGLLQGANAVVGTPGDISRFADWGPTYGIAKLAELSDRHLGTHLLPQGKTASDLYNAAQGASVPEAMSLPTSADLQANMDKVAPGLNYTPQTTAGRYTKAATAGVPGALMAPGSIVGNAVKFGLLPGAAGEGAADATAGTGLENVARGGAALLTGGAAALASRPNVATRMVSQATRGADDAAINQATQLMQDAAGRGVQLTWPEALQQVTNSATPAGRLQRVVEGTKEGGAIMAPAMAQRPGQVQTAVGDVLGNISPGMTPARTAMAGQQAAEGVVTRASQLINAAERPYYDAANTRTVPPQDLHLISQDAAFQQALQNVRGDAIRNKDIAAFGVNEVPTLIAVRKELARMTENAMNRGPGLNPDRELARNISPIQDRLDQIITQTAPEYGQALGVGSALRQQGLEPLRRGPIGQIAQAADVGGQTVALFPAKPFEGQAAETGRAVRLMNMEDATAAPALVRQHLASNYAEAAQNLQPGQNQFGGAKFAANVAGNPLQRQALEAGIGNLPNGAQALPDVRGLLQVLEATGKRQQPGSLTAFNASDLKDMGSSGLLGSAVDSVKSANPMPLISQLKENFDRARLGARSEDVARGLLSTPEEAGRLLRRARSAAPDGNGARLLLGLLAGAKPSLLGM